MILIEELLNPKNDYVFKRIFGYKGNEDITKQMLSVVLKKEINSIKLNESPILEKDLIDDKIGIVDIHAKIDNSIDVEIEMQVVNEKNIEKRMMYYWSKLYISGIQNGEQYSKLHKTIAILIADFELEKLKSIPNFYTKWQIREEKYQSVILTDILELYIIEIPKATKNNITNNKKIFQDIAEIEPWIAFLENPEDVEMVEMSKQNTVAIKRAKEVLTEISKDEYERYIAHLREKHIRDTKAVEEYGYDKGIEKGIQQRYATSGRRNDKTEITNRTNNVNN